MEQTICYAWMESPVGGLLLGADDRGLRYVLFGDGRDARSAREAASGKSGRRQDITPLREAMRARRSIERRSKLHVHRGTPCVRKN